MWLLMVFDFLETWWKQSLGCPELKKKYSKNPSVWALHFLSRVMGDGGEIWQKSQFFKKNYKDVRKLLFG
jgi:hypothetical protein